MATLFAVIVAALLAGSSPEEAGAVVFVCEHGSAKSVVAAAHFNRMAAERGLGIRAISRGTVPDAELAPAAIAGLRKDGLTPAEPVPRKLEQANLDAAVRVVTFCDLPTDLTARAPVERWEVPPVSTEYSAPPTSSVIPL